MQDEITGAVERNIYPEILASERKLISMYREILDLIVGGDFPPWFGPEDYSEWVKERLEEKPD